jgi:hypothetical protein
MEVVLEDNGLKEFIDKDVPKPDAANLDAWKKKVVKVRRILLEGVRYHIVSNLHGKSTSYEMWKDLTTTIGNWHSKINFKKSLIPNQILIMEVRRRT